jgi:hypothetical protein
MRQRSFRVGDVRGVWEGAFALGLPDMVAVVM